MNPTENEWQNKRIIKMITNEMTSKIDEQNEYTHTNNKHCSISTIILANH